MRSSKFPVSFPINSGKERHYCMWYVSLRFRLAHVIIIHLKLCVLKMEAKEQATDKNIKHGLHCTIIASGKISWVFRFTFLLQNKWQQNSMQTDIKTKVNCYKKKTNHYVIKCYVLLMHFFCYTSAWIPLLWHTDALHKTITNHYFSACITHLLYRLILDHCGRGARAKKAHPLYIHSFNHVTNQHVTSYFLGMLHGEVSFFLSLI
jgi:hypothetical protein